MEDVCVWITCICYVLFGSCYVYKIWNGTEATAVTWLIFLVGCGPSFVTYIIAADKDLKSGILNTADIAYVTVVLIAIFMKTDHEILLKPFDRWYLVAAGLIVLYAMTARDAWYSNIALQFMMVGAYWPMWRKMYKRKRKLDSYFAWLPQAFTSIVALYPAIAGGKILAIIYASRSLLCALLMVSIMLYYQIRYGRATPAASR